MTKLPDILTYVPVVITSHLVLSPLSLCAGSMDSDQPAAKKAKGRKPAPYSNKQRVLLAFAYLVYLMQQVTLNAALEDI